MVGVLLHLILPTRRFATHDLNPRIVSLRQSGVGTGFVRTDATLPKGRCGAGSALLNIVWANKSQARATAPSLLSATRFCCLSARLARWGPVTALCPTSTGAFGSCRDLTQSRKFLTCGSVGIPPLYSWVGLGGISGRRHGSG